MAEDNSTHELNLSSEEGTFTVYEKARLIGSRALQLSQGAKPLLDFSEEDFVAMKYNPVEIAKREFDAGIIPLSVRRSLPHE
jgi:DNA-directed RNA polymerase subunit K